MQERATGESRYDPRRNVVDELSSARSDTEMPADHRWRNACADLRGPADGGVAGESRHHGFVQRRDFIVIEGLFSELSVLQIADVMKILRAA